MIDHSRLIKKTATYSISTSTTVQDRVLMEIATQYQTNVSGKFIALKPDDLPKRYTGSEKVLATTKVDGEGVFAFYDDSKGAESVFLFNAPSGRVRLGLPVAAALAQSLKAKGVKKALLRAELYLPSSVDGKRYSNSDVARSSFSQNQADLDPFKLAVFDIIMLDGEDWRVRQTEFETIWNRIGELFGSDETKNVHRVSGDVIAEDSLPKYFDDRVNTGLEGLVVRRLTRPEVVKVKPHLTFDTAIIGYVEKDLEGEPGVASILTGLVYPKAPDGKLAVQVFARVGSGLDDAQRKALLAQLKPHAVTAPLSVTDSDGRPIVFVKPVHVLEIEADDVVSAVKNEKENTSQFMSWDGSAWTYYRQAVCPRVSFPIYGKLRSDKSVDSGASISQLIADAVTPPLAAAEKGAAPQVLRREVYRKEGKAGDVALRKLVVVQKFDPDTYPYVVFWTDYSSKRKDPLKVTTQFAATSERAEKLASVLIEEGVTKGFVRAA